jgi:WD40 repeat protein
MSAGRALDRFRAPGEHEAEERAWATVHSAYRDRVPAAQKRSYRRPAVGLAAGVALLGALALSPAGATVGHLITRALGVQHAARTLSLPTRGRLLVSDARGTWLINADGSTKRLGPWAQASWSPHGLYVTTAGGNELRAIDPTGTLQWSLTRPSVTDPQWYPPLGYRVAYLSGSALRVVAGDGTGDRLFAARVTGVAPAWRPNHAYQLAYVTEAGRLVVRDADSGRVAWSAAVGPAVERLDWSANGQRLLVLAPKNVRIYDGAGRLRDNLRESSKALAVDGALSPDGHMVALVLGGSGSVVAEDLEVDNASPRRVLAGAGLRQLAWSPDGRWLLVSWPAANQWVFIRVVGTPRIAAVSRIRQQFSAQRRGGFPKLDGWCCTVHGAAG